MPTHDAIVIGSGPNGLCAAIELATAGLSVHVVEARDTIGGGARTEELTLPGFRHDVCSAIHPMGMISPYLRSLPLAQHGLQWVDPPVALAHPFDDGSASVLLRDLDATAERMGQDGNSYRALLGPFVKHSDAFFREILKPIRIPRHPFLMARFGLSALRSCVDVVRRFRHERTRAIFAGCAAHSVVPLDRLATASFGMVLAASAHAAGWPCAKGGSQSIITALAAHLKSLGGEISTGQRIETFDQVSSARAVIADVTPRQLADIAGDRFPPSYQRQLRNFRYGPGVFKIDWALSAPIPWKAADCLQSATVHVGGPIEEIVRGEDEVGRGKHPERPFVLLAQQSLFDPTRAPSGKHTGWAYCHVPSGSTVDMTAAIERQVERFAPGFRDVILSRHTINSVELQEHNANMIGGDIGGGANDLVQFLARPLLRWNPYSTPDPRIFLGSSSTPPGGGVHGMCGYWAARTALRRLFGK